MSPPSGPFQVAFAFGCFSTKQKWLLDSQISSPTFPASLYHLAVADFPTLRSSSPSLLFAPRPSSTRWSSQPLLRRSILHSLVRIPVPLRAHFRSSSSIPPPPQTVQHNSDNLPAPLLNSTPYDRPGSLHLCSTRFLHPPTASSKLLPPTGLKRYASQNN
jgi:hypothetical protein